MTKAYKYDKYFFMDSHRLKSDKTFFRQTKQILNEEGYTPDSQLLSSLLNSLPLNVFAKNYEGQFIYANDYYCKNVGRTYEELLGIDDYDIHPKELADKYREDDIRVMTSRQAESIEEPWDNLKGADGYKQVIKSPLYSSVNKEEVIGLIGVFWDITARKDAEIALAEERNLLRTLIDIVPDYIYVKDLKSKFMVANKAVAQVMEAGTPDDLIGKTDHEYFSKADADNFRQDEQHVIKEQEPLLNKEESYIDRGGTKRWTITSKLPLHNIEKEVIGVVGIGHNITRQKEDEKKRQELEKQLWHAQKMEAIGTLAGGLAHDFNNLLMGIQGHASLIETEIDAAHPFNEHIKAIERCVQSASRLNSQLLGFARGGQYEVKPIGLNKLIDDTAEMFGRTRKELSISKAFEKDLWMVRADSRQLEQVLLNLLINAWQSMDESLGRDIHLRTENMVLEKDYTSLHSLSPGRYVKISITDTGKGMNEETCQRIFDPFFTTKEIGRGTGLGLASAYGIIKQHGGMIEVDSEPDKGTTFNICLPASGSDEYREAEPDKSIVNGSETILLVDDEPMILDVGKALLEKLGYSVIAAEGGREAIEIISKTGDEIDLIILDLIMPDMDGSQTFDSICKIKPGCPVMISSGYSISGQAAEIMKRGCKGFIQKPFQVSTLSRAVRKILD